MKPAVIADIILVVFLLRFFAEDNLLQCVPLALLWALMTGFFLRESKKKGEYANLSLPILWAANAFLTLLMICGFVFLDRLPG
ncbi:hypothetical protein [Mitsuokella sp. AF21-1AC]|uniref:hypothetical protein n=1 Tax=Mitsuokella sp. AF21-1AC TaxID=2292235 RepID=UPI000E474F03|nr:hypothetical protein [Mitsuokella sp. AF21-1AC]RGS71438.1 hypothetical protein DWX75_08750 [Mitsuokella sp. AF21-1AC]